MQRRKGWLIKQSFNNDFVDKLEELYKKYNEEVFSVQGIANKHMDIAQFSKSFFEKSAAVADSSVDPNANVREKSITAYNYENNKALMKLNSLYLLHRWITKTSDLESANKALEKVINGELFVNDLTNFNMPYCYAFDLRQLLMEGMNFFQGNMKIKPPKRSESFIALVIQSTAYISNQIMGAVSYPDFFVVLDYFYRKEFGENYADKLFEDFIQLDIDGIGYVISGKTLLNIKNKETQEISQISASDFFEKRMISTHLVDIDSLKK